MEDDEKILSEKKYQKTKRKISFIAILVFLIGVSIGGFLIGTGIKKQNEINNTQANRRTEASIQAEIDELKDNLAVLRAKQNQEFRNNGLSEEYYKQGNEIDKMQKKVSELDSEIWKTKNGYGTAGNIQKYLPFYIFGGVIIFTTLMISGQIYLISKGREIMAYTAQQSIPVAQEGIEKMAPTMRKVGKETMEEMAPVFGEVAKEIAKGIKEGKEEEKDD